MTTGASEARIASAVAPSACTPSKADVVCIVKRARSGAPNTVVVRQGADIAGVAIPEPQRGGFVAEAAPKMCVTGAAIAAESSIGIPTAEMFVDSHEVEGGATGCVREKDRPGVPVREANATIRSEPDRTNNDDF